MIKFLGDGMVGSEDWRILKRRHTWDLLASLFQSADGVEDTSLRMGILEVGFDCDFIYREALKIHGLDPC